MTTVRPFGVVIEVTVGKNEIYYVLLVNDFEKYKTFGNGNLETKPFVVFDVTMKELVEEESGDLYDRIEKIVIDKVVNENE